MIRNGVAVIDKFQKTILAATTLICMAVIAVVYMSKPKNETVCEAFAPPGFEAAAENGTPDITDRTTFYSTMEIPITSGRCEVSMNAAPKLNKGDLDVYFTNSADNTVWLKLVIYDKAEKQIAESGILKNGEYVKAVKTNETITAGEELKAKILTYEPDTYYSLGSARATLKVQ